MLNICNIQNNFHLSKGFSCRIEVKPEYLGLDTHTTADFSNNTGYTFQLQASTQMTIPKIGTGP